MTANDQFLDQLASPRFCERLFAHLPDVVFCLKDAQRRYRAVNRAFSARIGVDNPAELLGGTAEEWFPPHLAEVYRAQDELVLSTGQEMADRLELVTNRDGSLGWYLATKVPLHDAKGRVIGVASISRDLGTPREEDPEFTELERIVSYIQHHLDEPLKPTHLAKAAGLSPSQLDRRMRRVFQLTTAQFIRKTRIGHAAQLLTTTHQPVADIALACGYGDQTAFTRQFRSTVGLPPASYREHSKHHV